MQPASGYQWKIAGTAGPGTILVTDRAVVLGKIVIPGTYTGTTVFYDCNATDGTATTNAVMTIGLPGAYTPTSLDIHLQFKNGMVCTQSGTPALLLGLN